MRNKLLSFYRKNFSMLCILQVTSGLVEQTKPITLGVTGLKRGKIFVAGLCCYSKGGEWGVGGPASQQGEPGTQTAFLHLCSPGYPWLGRMSLDLYQSFVWFRSGGRHIDGSRDIVHPHLLSICAHLTCSCISLFSSIIKNLRWTNVVLSVVMW